ncbi:hypothetical protein [Paenibacillus durus]|uniref:Uncharacterized protein n=1 Tax=Paenibacillus durus TaxID=44251 RepID=A0A089HHT5_PAEDU|nr:hypothetical protein [Paenibacillus durus]AIQ11506.1 hypothetical protein PDUR_05735 [Paenibacillus durus]
MIDNKDPGSSSEGSILSGTFLTNGNTAGDQAFGGSSFGGVIPESASTMGIATPDIDLSQPQERKKSAPGAQWNPDQFLSISIFPKDSTCFGDATPSYQNLFSSGCGNVEQCGSPFIFDILYHVDADGVPRPAPFTPPKLTLDVKFIDTSGSVVFQKQATDNNPVYRSAGSPLKTTFGTRFTINTTKNGKLQVNLKMLDSDTGKMVRYTDSIQCIIIDCS